MGSHTRNVLTLRKIQASDSKKMRDGGGLWLITRPSGKYWIFSYTLNGRRRDMGIGPFHLLTLPEARDAAAKAREMVKCGIDPIRSKRQTVVEQPETKTFGQYADEFIDRAVSHGRWRGNKTEARWRNMMNNHAATIRERPIADIDIDDVKNVLRPLWGKKQESAEKLRECIERVLDAARVDRLRMGDNPAAWRGNLEHVLHKPARVEGEGHHAAMPHDRMSDFMKSLAGVQGVSARCLEFTILTAARSGSSRGALWTEFDFKNKIWTVPAVRMKTGKTHRVPLSKAVVALLERMKAQSINEYVFPSVRSGKPLSDMALGKALASAGGGDYTPHGFRSTFRDWATEVAHAPREIAEAALSHAVGDAVERSYARSDALQRRHTLMEEWAKYCLSTKS
jgi:integrase